MVLCELVDGMKVTRMSYSAEEELSLKQIHLWKVITFVVRKIELELSVVGLVIATGLQTKSSAIICYNTFKI